MLVAQAFEFGLRISRRKLIITTQSLGDNLSLQVDMGPATGIISTAWTVAI